MNYMSSFGVRGNLWTRAGQIRRPRLGALRRQPSTEYALAAAIVVMTAFMLFLGTVGF